MNRRKIAYLVALVVLLAPLSLLSQPATKNSAGGKLARLRTEYRLDQANLGEIDVAGETMKLATMGLRVVAVMLQWDRAQHYKKVEDWNKMASALNQLTKLEPNIISFWHHQGWNISYNVSVEFDDYRDRYFWVIKGIRFLMDGARRNVYEPSLNWDTGWFITQKIGRSDDRKMYRQMFVADDEFHGARRRDARDNWLVGREYFLEAERVIDRTGFSIKGVQRVGDTRPGINPLLFHSDPPMCLINYAGNLETDGRFGRDARQAWSTARDGWLAYGRRDITTTGNRQVQLEAGDAQRKLARDSVEELEKLVPEGTRDKILAERTAALSAAERDAWETSVELRNDEQKALAELVFPKLVVRHADVAARADADKRAEALRLAEVAHQAEDIAEQIDVERQVVNYNYWRVRTEAESTENAVNAREAIHGALAAMKAGRLKPADELFDRGFAQWRLVFDKFPTLMEPNDVTMDLAEVIAEYRKLLDQLDKPFPKEFILQEVIELDQALQPGGTFPPQPNS